MENRLYRSRTDQMVAGVCGGLGRYLRIDPVIVRIFFLLLLFTSGIGFPLYLVMWIVIPYEGEAAAGTAETARAGGDEISARAARDGRRSAQCVQ